MSGESPHELAKSLVLRMLPRQVVTERELEENVDGVLSMLGGLHPDHVFDRDRIIRELQADLSIFQPDSVSLDDETGHEEWIDLAQEEILWRYWDRYARYLRESEEFPPAVVGRLDSTTLSILGKLEDPNRRGSWDRRGMVVGQIQSGKTGNYTGLICRAADAGYKLVVVLAGMYNNLRSQTQVRLDEGFLGFDTQKRPQTRDDADFIAAAMGVGRLIGAPRLHPASLTDSADNGDFLVKRASSLGLLIGGGDPVLLVVKKHRGILTNLRDWLRETHGTGEPRLVREFAAIVIDDEADNASINTRDPIDPATGEYSDDLEPTKVNGAIRELLNLFQKKAYVGYTATPFANIYIPDDLDHAKYGPELFPSGFIQYLRPPSNYFGPARLFGVDGEGDPLPIYRSVEDYVAWIPDRHRMDLRVGPMPDSLKRAIRCFILARAARLARDQSRSDNSMLVHVTRFTAVQAQVRDQVEEELNALRARIKFGDGDRSDIRQELHDLWFSDFENTSAAFGDAVRVEWDEVDGLLQQAVEPIVVRTINGTAKDTLDYFENRDRGFNVIAIGGAKLSRGLTLEGLTVSYYLRTTQAADTLLQMSRWFGFRDGYDDLCRLWTTSRLWQSFHEVTEANEELIREFEEMAARGKSPSEYGLKVQNSMAGMMVTDPNKMRAGTRLRVGFSGAISETVSLYCDPVTADANVQSVDAFIALLNGSYSKPDVKQANLLWSRVSGSDIADEFFAEYRAPEGAWRVHPQTIAEYIRNRVGAKELVEWTVALISNSMAAEQNRFTIAGHEIGLTHRDFNAGVSLQALAEGRYSIRRILNPPDETLDFSDEARERALEETVEAWERNGRQHNGKPVNEPTRPSGDVIRHMRPRTEGLLLIYPLETPDEKYRIHGLLTEGPLMGFAVSFPFSDDAPTMDYVVNQQFLRELLAEDD